MAGPATCHAEGIVIRSEPITMALHAPEVQVAISEPQYAESPTRRQPALEQRVAALYVLLDDVRRERRESPIRGDLAERSVVLLLRILSELDNGDHDG